MLSNFVKASCKLFIFLILKSFIMSKVDAYRFQPFPPLLFFSSVISSYCNQHHEVLFVCVCVCGWKINDISNSCSITNVQSRG